MKPRHPARSRALITALFLSGGAALFGTEIVAHRGASHDAPENTMAATHLAWAQNADAVETDVYLSKDGQIVVFHDRTAKRTAGRDVPIESMTAAEARELDAGSWKGPQFAGEKIPLLEEQLVTIPPGKKILVEIKVGAEIVPELVRVFGRTNATPDKIVIISFNLGALLEVRKQLPDYKTLWLVGYRLPEADGAPASPPPPTVDEMIVQATAAGFAGLDLQHTWPLDAAAVNKIKAAGLELHVWTVNEVAIAQRWIGLGAASLTTNRPAWMREQLKL